MVGLYEPMGERPYEIAKLHSRTGGYSWLRADRSITKDRTGARVLRVLGSGYSNHGLKIGPPRLAERGSH